ncbi:MAG: DUF4396 domain-containing protein [Patescibacteria group bacterium]
MEHTHHAHAHTSLNKVAFSATLHCLTGCAIGEVFGMVIGTAFGLSNAVTIFIAIALAFAFGYSLTLLPLVRSGMALGTALGLAFASDTLSITTMEIVDNVVMVFIPGALDAELTTFMFWGSLAVSLAIAGVAAYPVNRWLIARGKGHAVLGDHHNH